MSDAEALFICVHTVSAVFEKEPAKATAWFETKNLNLGGVSPMEMIRMGRVQKLREIIIALTNGALP